MRGVSFASVGWCGRWGVTAPGLTCSVRSTVDVRRLRHTTVTHLVSTASRRGRLGLRHRATGLRHGVALTASGKWKVLRARRAGGERLPDAGALRARAKLSPRLHGVVLAVVAEALGHDRVAEEEGQVRENVLARGRDGAGRGELLGAFFVS